MGTHFLGTTDAQDFAIYTNNMEKIRVNQNGNVGIGTTNPSNLFHVSGNTDANDDSLMVVTNAGRIAIGTSTTNNDIIVLRDEGASIAQYSYNDASTLGPHFVAFRGRGTPSAQLHPDSADALGIFSGRNYTNLSFPGMTISTTENHSNTEQGSKIKFSTVPNGSTSTISKVHIDHDGNVGIGVANPDGLLHIASDVTGVLDTTLIVDNNCNLGIGTLTPDQALVVNGEGTFGTDSEKYPNILSVVGTNGEVIAGPTGNTQLVVSNAADAGLAIHAANTGFSRVYFGRNGSSGNNAGRIQYDHANNSLDFFTAPNGTSAGSEHVTINSGGNVGIGTTTPTNKLHLDNTDLPTAFNIMSRSGSNVQNFSIKADHAQSYVHFDISGSGHSANWFHFGDLTGTNNNITTLGNIGIGTTSPSHKLHVTGAARSTQANWDTSSDKRVKKNINDLGEGLEELLKIRPVTFEYTKSYQKYNTGYEGIKRGFIAQEVKEIFPSMVNIINELYGNNIIEDFHVLNNSDFTPILVKAIQEQQQIIEGLKKENNTLKAEKANQTDLEKLQVQVNELQKILEQSSIK